MAKIGRPTDYRPEYCKRVVAMGKEGKSMAQMASVLGQARSTLQQWGEEWPEFTAALTRARTESQRWWEDKGQDNLGADKFQSSVWRTSMQARFREEYTERRDHTVQGEVAHRVIEWRGVKPEDGA